MASEIVEGDVLLKAKNGWQASIALDSKECARKLGSQSPHGEWSGGVF